MSDRRRDEIAHRERLHLSEIYAELAVLGPIWWLQWTFEKAVSMPKDQARFDKAKKGLKAHQLPGIESAERAFDRSPKDGVLEVVDNAIDTLYDIRRSIRHTKNNAELRAATEAGMREFTEMAAFLTSTREDLLAEIPGT